MQISFDFAAGSRSRLKLTDLLPGQKKTFFPFPVNVLKVYGYKEVRLIPHYI